MHTWGLLPQLRAAPVQGWLSFSGQGFEVECLTPKASKLDIKSQDWFGRDLGDPPAFAAL